MDTFDYNLPADDDVLLKQILQLLGDRIDTNPYENNGAFAAQIKTFPVGLRAMAATYQLDISLSLDDIGWHFLNFGEENQVKETEGGLSELGLPEVCSLFITAYQIVSPLIAQLRKTGGNYYECIKEAGQFDRLEELSTQASTLLGPGGIFPHYVAYARKHPANVFLPYQSREALPKR